MSCFFSTPRLYHKPPDRFPRSFVFTPTRETQLGIFSRRKDKKRSQRGGEGRDEWIWDPQIRSAGCARIVHLHCRLLCAAVVRVVRLVVHHQLIVHKVEAVGLRLVRVQDHLPDCEEAPNTRSVHKNSNRQKKTKHFF